MQSRSHSLTVRSLLREAVGTTATSLDMLADRVIAAGRERPGTALPDPAAGPGGEGGVRAVLAGRRRWRRCRTSVRKRVAKRLAFDAVLEFGLQSQLGRTLEMTSTVAAEVEAAPGLMTTAARQAIEEGGGEALLPVEAHGCRAAGLGPRRPEADA